MSKKNELTGLKKTLSRAQKANIGDLQKLYTKLEIVRGEVKKTRSNQVYTDANVIGFDKINEAKGILIDLESKQAKLESEANSLRSVKDEQFK